MHIFLFHRDLRLSDNTSLLSLCSKIAKGVICPIFIFPPQQISPKLNPYFSNKSVQFMIQSLNDLNEQIRDYNENKKELVPNLLFFKGSNIQILQQIHTRVGIKSISFNLDYTPFAKKRDLEITKWAQKNKILTVTEEDYALYEILNGQTISKNTNRPFLVFTPFKNFCLANLKVRKPQSLPDPTKIKIGLTQQNLNLLRKIGGFMEPKDLKTLYEDSDLIKVKGGRSQSLKILQSIKKFTNYNQTRNTPSINTTNLSAHLHFTTVSIREVYYCVLEKLGKQNNIINEIHWRDFYYNIGNHYPNTLNSINSNQRSFKPKFDQIPWKYNDNHLNAWKQGKTGFPIVDAGMRQLNATGFMHNRCRMITASFFSKQLFLDWRLGEQYFATKLVDYSPMQNSGGWQWCVGNGTDSQPYFRIFNPWTQQKNYDTNCEYIKKWVPQLEKVKNEDIHNWFKCYEKQLKRGIKYYKPIVDHDETRKQALETYSIYLKKQ